MILPTPTVDRRRQRLVSAAGTCIVMLGLYATVRGTPVPALESASAAVRRLNPVFVERYAAPPPPEVAPDEAAEPAPDVSSTGAIDREVVSAIDELTRKLGGEDVVSGGGAFRNAARGGGIGGIDTDPSASRFSEVFGGLTDPVAAVTAPRGHTPALRTPDAGTAGLAIGARPQRAETAPTERPDDVVDFTVGAPTQREAHDEFAADVVIREYAAENFDAFAVDALASWMRANPRDLPVGIQVHLDYVPSFLTAAAPFTAGDREFELYLMYNESLRELHIVLVEGDRSVYLIDRGFQAQSRSLREGRVRRLEGEIMAVDSQRRAASGERAQEFYDIFLSWWETARK